MFKYAIERILNFNFSQKEEDILIRLGSKYGGWYFCKCENHFKDSGFFISAGVGEDISFDIEIMKISKLAAVFIDPTERSEAHIQSVLDFDGNATKSIYNKSGKQASKNYGISNDIKLRIIYIKKALWINSDGIALYPPRNLEHVSFSKKRKSSKSIATFFESINLKEVNEYMYKNYPKQNGIISSKPKIIKMDIEGSEYEVLKQILKSDFVFEQILVELDFLREKNIIMSVAKLIKLIYFFRQSNYRIAMIEGINLTLLKEK